MGTEPKSAEIGFDEAKAGKEPFLWKTAVLFVLLVVGIFVPPVMLFAFFVLFVYWSYVSLMVRETNLIEPVRRETHPVMYWVLIGLYVFFAGWCAYGFVMESYRMIAGSQ